jgi:hypothetical protein
MTKSEFLSSIPSIIEHNTWGFAELEIIVDKKDIKGVCYRHKDKTASGGTYDTTRLKVHDKLKNYLEEGGYL